MTHRNKIGLSASRATELALALALTACSSASGVYTTSDVSCLAAQRRVICPDREGFGYVASCDGVAVTVIGSGWWGGPVARFGQIPTCAIDGSPPSCDSGGTPQCTYVPSALSDPDRWALATEACIAAGFDQRAGVCYVDPVTNEVIEIDLEWQPEPRSSW